MTADDAALYQERDDALLRAERAEQREAELEAENEELRDRQRDEPVFRCQTHLCGSCGGCKRAGIKDENTALRNELAAKEAENAELRAALAGDLGIFQPRKDWQ